MKVRTDKVDAIAKKLQLLKIVRAGNTRMASDLARRVFKEVRGTDLEDRLTDGQLRDLCGKLSQRTATPQEAISQYVKPAAAMRKVSDRNEPQRDNSEPQLKILPNPSRAKANTKDIWNDISEFNRQQQETDRQIKAMKKKQQQKVWQQQLQKQMQEAQNEQKRQENDTRQYAKQKADELEQWKSQEQQKALNLKKRAQNDKLLQDEQRRRQRERQETEQRQKDEADARMMTLLKRQMEEDQRKDQERRLAGKKKMERVQIENKQNLAVKAKIAEQNRQYDLKLQADYVQMENKKEADREAKLKEMADRIAAKMAMGADVIAEQDNRDQENENRAKKEQVKYNTQRQKEEAKRKRLAKKRTDDQLKSLDRQVVEKRRQEQQYEREMLDQARIWQKQVVEYDAAEKRKNDIAKKRNRDQQKWLERQIQDKAGAAGKCDQSALELQMNKSILKQIASSRLTQSSSGMSIAESTRARSAEIDAQQRMTSQKAGEDMLKSLESKSKARY